MQPDGTFFEAEGIKPDIFVEINRAEMANRDQVLEAALKFLREQ